MLTQDCAHEKNMSACVELGILAAESDDFENAEYWFKNSCINNSDENCELLAELIKSKNTGY